VFVLDSWLRRRHGVFEFSNNPQCIFRLQRSTATQRCVLSDGVAVAPGDALLTLHIWNEHMPQRGAGSSLAWAKQLSRAIDRSLHLLHDYLRDNADDYSQVAAVCAEMKLGPATYAAQLAQLSARFGFEWAPAQERPARRVSRIGENIFMLMLVVASNPRSASLSVLKREPMTAYLSRRALERCYGGRAAGAD
jgi:hypothetical protein